MAKPRPPEAGGALHLDAHPARASQHFLRLEALLVAHLLRALDPVAEIEIRHADLARVLQVLEDHVGAEAALRGFRLVERVDHRDAVGEPVAERHAHQGLLAAARIRVGLQPIFGDERVDDAVFHHHGVVEHRHVGHAAVRVACIDVVAEERVLL